MVNKGEYIEPWSRQKELQKRYSDDVPDIDELAEIIEGIKYGQINIASQTFRARALVALYYLTAARVSEITRCKSLRRQTLRKKPIIDRHGRKIIVYEVDEFNDPIVDKWDIKHEYIGIRKKDIVLKKIDSKLCMLIRTENRKNKSKLTKRLPIPLGKELTIVSFVIEYLKLLDDEDILFPFTHKRAQQIINDTTGFNVHFLRHIRATHLITKYDFNEQLLVRFMGWTDARPAKHYMELRSHDIFRQFYR